MSIRKQKRHNLSSLQLSIIQHLANSGPQDIHEIAIGMSKQYKSIHRAFQSLKRSELVSQVGAKTYRGKNYPQYWLSTMGVYEALINEVSSEKLLETTKKLIPENSMLHCCLEIAPYISTDVFRIGLLAIKEQRKIREDEALAMMLANEQTNPAPETYMKIAEIMIKYPKVVELLKKRFEEMKSNMNQLSEFMKNKVNVLKLASFSMEKKIKEIKHLKWNQIVNSLFVYTHIYLQKNCMNFVNI